MTEKGNGFTTRPLTAFSETAAKFSFAAAALFLVLLTYTGSKMFGSWKAQRPKRSLCFSVLTPDLHRNLNRFVGNPED